MHAVFAFGLTGYGGHLFGDAGCAYGAAIAVMGGLCWEIVNRWTPGEHQHADLLDFVAFLAGAALAAGGFALSS